jgi:DNA-binding response OmpR family regulator
MSAPTILIVEDDAALLRGLKDNFEAQGYDVRTANNGQKGLDSLLENPPDLLLLDLMLPKVTGYDICRAARERKLDLPIIMLTAKGQEEDIVRGLELGADDYVTKPFSIRELIARVRAFLRRQPPGAVEYGFPSRRRRPAHCQGISLAGVFCQARRPRPDARQHPGRGLGPGGVGDRPQCGPLRDDPAREN